MSWSETFDKPRVRETAEFCRDSLGLEVTLRETGKWGDPYYGVEEKLYEATIIAPDRTVVIRDVSAGHHVSEYGDGAHNVLKFVVITEPPRRAG